MKTFFMLVIVFALVLVGCSEKSPSQKVSPIIKNNSDIQEMPEDMPSDFGFSVSFGVGKKNEINTFSETVTKDLIEEGTITENIALTDEEMNEIYQRMKEIHIKETLKLVPDSINGSICVQEPYEEDEWEIKLDGETITHSVSGTYCKPTDEAKQLVDLRNSVFKKIKSRKEYMELPDSKGGYE